MWAAKSGHAPAVDFLIKSGADVDKVGGWVNVIQEFNSISLECLLE